MYKKKRHSAIDELARIQIRNQLKDEHRLYLTDSLKKSLEEQGCYTPKSRSTHSKFAKLHDEINLLITGESSVQAKTRTGLKSSELLRDYLPLDKLVYYSALSVSAANTIKDGYDPIKAVHFAPKQVLPRHYKPEPIEPVNPCCNRKNSGNFIQLM